MDKQDGLASVQKDELSSRDGKLNCQEKSAEAFYPPSSPPKAFYPSTNEDEEREVAFPSILAALKRSQNSQNKSLLSISSSDLSSSSGEEEEELERGEEGGRSLPESPESNSNKDEVRE